MMARSVTIQVDYVTEPVDGECPECGFNALRRVTAYHLGHTGVTVLARRTFCGRCVAEQRRERGA